MNITDFLLARIAEDEAVASELLRDLKGEISEEYAHAVDERGPMTPDRLLSAKMWAHYDGRSKRRSFARGQQIARLASPERMLAECSAKRAIIRLSEDVESLDYQVTNEYGGEIDGTGEDILKALAGVYANHPDYQEEWRLS